ncbi:hypothetical protein OG612_45435 (plasmid) [Streptomyces sp. NBC_01527]|uniref:hypothetical protein n=1 Tax=Streptomyces sp. NBC_01527 TaxID=2903894 RepID=UPI002F91B898
MANEPCRAYLYLATVPTTEEPRLRSLLTRYEFRDAPSTTLPPRLVGDALYRCDSFPVGENEDGGTDEFAYDALVDALVRCAPGAAWRLWSGTGYADGMQIMGQLNLYHPALGRFPEPSVTLPCDEDGHPWLDSATVTHVLQRAQAGEVIDPSKLFGTEWDERINQASRSSAA